MQRVGDSVGEEVGPLCQRIGHADAEVVLLPSDVLLSNYVLLSNHVLLLSVLGQLQLHVGGHAVHALHPHVGDGRRESR